MPEILQTLVVGERPLDGPRPVFDPVTQQAVDAAVAAAEARGHAAGEAAGRAAAAAFVQELSAAVGRALDELHAEVRGQRAAMVQVSLELARAASEAVLGASPPPGASQLLERVRAATELLDDERLELRAHPGDAATLVDAGLDPRLTVVADADLAPGDLRVSGTWGRAELTRQALVEAAVATLAAASEVAP